MAWRVVAERPVSPKERELAIAWNILRKYDIQDGLELRHRLAVVTGWDPDDVWAWGHIDLNDDHQVSVPLTLGWDPHRCRNVLIRTDDLPKGTTALRILED